MDRIDAYLRKRIMKLSDRKRSPITGKARLLLAAQYSNSQKESPEYSDHPVFPPFRVKQPPQRTFREAWIAPSTDLFMGYLFPLSIVNPRLL